jgi:hypothetical protein
LSKVNNEVELNNIKTTVINAINNPKPTTDTSTNTVITTTSAAVASTSKQRRTRRKSSRTQNTPTVSTERYELDQFNISVSEECKELYDQLT